MTRQPGPGQCGEPWPQAAGTRCTRPAAHEGGHRDQDAGRYWQAEPAGRVQRERAVTARACWADPLSREERRELAGKLARAARTFGAASGVARSQGDGPLGMSLVLASGEAAVLYTDITERARAAAS